METLLIKPRKKSNLKPHEDAKMKTSEQDWEHPLMVSNGFHIGMLTANTKIIVFDSKKFESIIFIPLIIRSKIPVTFAHDQKHDLRRKVAKLDQIMK